MYQWNRDIILTPTLGLCLTILKAQVKIFGINLDSDIKHEVSTNYKLKPKSNMTQTYAINYLSKCFRCLVTKAQNTCRLLFPAFSLSKYSSSTFVEFKFKESKIPIRSPQNDGKRGPKADGIWDRTYKILTSSKFLKKMHQM